MSSKHDPVNCPACESVPPDRHGRHWKHQAPVGRWHVIAEGPDLMTRLPRQAHFVTILSYRINAEGMPTQYRGPLYGDFDAPNPTQAFEDLRCCVEMLVTMYDCPTDAIRVWHSGGDGPHMTIPPLVLGAEAGHPQLPRIYDTMIQRLFPPHIAPTLDRGIYSGGQGRMWRLPNRRRFDTRRYKVPLAMREVLHKPYADIEELTLRPRKGLFWPPDEEISPCPQLVHLYREAARDIQQAGSPPPSPAGAWGTSRGHARILLGRCAFIRYCQDHARTLAEPLWYAMVSNVARCMNGPTAVHELSAPYPTYSRQETDAKIAHALRDTGPHTCAFIQAQGFTGCPSGGCGVKAPIGLAHHRLNGLRVSDATVLAGYIRTAPAEEMAAWL